MDGSPYMSKAAFCYAGAFARRMMMASPDRGRAARRGLTLVEILCALSLLAVLTGGLSAWLTVALRDVPAMHRRLHLEAAAGAAIDRIREDLFTGDVELDAIEVHKDAATAAFIVISRAIGFSENAGPVRREYAVQNRRFVVIESGLPQRKPPITRTLLGDIAVVKFDLLSVPSGATDAGVLRVELRPTMGAPIVRTVRWVR